MGKDTQKIKDEIFNLECELAQLKGEFLGTLKGILFWDGVICNFPPELKKDINLKINELQMKKGRVKPFSMVELEEIFWKKGYESKVRV